MSDAPATVAADPPAAPPAAAADQARLQDALDRLTAFAGRLDPGGREASRTGGAFFDVLGVATEAIGVPLRVSAQDLSQADIERKLSAYGHISGFRFRQVTLDGRWWNDAAAPLLAVKQETGEP
ncbi:MAG TPA: hypothetical protein VK597_07125, partial [Inquilinus sp.]|nr:hypothetical protein [Inquilinus sp.]